MSLLGTTCISARYDRINGLCVVLNLDHCIIVWERTNASCKHVGMLLSVVTYDFMCFVIDKFEMIKKDFLKLKYTIKG